MEMYNIYIDKLGIKIINYKNITIIDEELYDIISIVNMCKLNVELKYKYIITLLNWKVIYSSKLNLSFNYNKFIIKSLTNLYNIDMEGYSKLYYLMDTATNI
jgi:hypothetical protein